MSELSRRAVLSTTGRAAGAAFATLGLGGVAVAAAAGEDAELRRLWAEYQEREAVALSAGEATSAARDAFDAVHRPKEPITDETTAQYDEYWKVFDADERIHQLYDASNELSKAQNRIVRAIRATPAEGLFGLAVKLAALQHGHQGEDVEDSAVAALGDINRILGTEFAIDGRTHFEEYGAWSDDDDEDEAEGDADA